ncbi:MAG: hypothetical protein KJN72_12340 [Woeseia sp.]|nr:hypothetical protein [Woeseia sp.]
MTKNQIKIYRMNDQDWWATTGDKDDAIREYAQECIGVVDVSEALDDGDICPNDVEELTPDELQHAVYLWTWNANDSGKIENISFKEALERMIADEAFVFPLLFASTEE